MTVAVSVYAMNHYNFPSLYSFKRMCTRSAVVTGHD